MSNDLIRRYVVRSLPIVAALGLASPAAYAWDFQNQDGTFSGSWDTTLTYGQAWRIEIARLPPHRHRRRRLRPLAEHRRRQPQLRHRHVQRARSRRVTELSLNYRGFGAFVRGSALYDVQAAESRSARELSDSSEGPGRTTCACSTPSCTPSSISAACRRRVAPRAARSVSWGESTFIQNGINVINHFDVSALRVPGSELKEAFLPQEMVNFSLQFNDNLSAQAIYILDWNATGAGAGRLVLQHQRFRARRAAARWCSASARSPTRAWISAPLGGPFITNFQNVNRLETAQADDDGPVRRQPQVLPAQLQQRH